MISRETHIIKITYLLTYLHTNRQTDVQNANCIFYCFNYFYIHSALEINKILTVVHDRYYTTNLHVFNYV